MARRVVLLAVLAAAALGPTAHADEMTFNTVQLKDAEDGTEPRLTVAPDDTRYVMTNIGNIPNARGVVLKSRDGGASFERVADPVGQSEASIDVDIIAYPTGRLLASELDYGGINFPSSVSDDGGKTWTASRGSTTLADQDRQWFAVDPHEGGKYVYLLYHNLASGVAQHNMWVATSSDAGLTFGPPIPIANPPTDAWNDLQCSDSGGPSSIQVNPTTGRVYAFWTTRSSTPTADGPNTGGCGASVFGPLEFNIVNATRVWSAYSDDHGQTWTQSLAVDDSKTGQIVSMQLAYGTLDNQGGVWVAYPESPKPYPDAGGAALKITHADKDLKKWSKPATLIPARADGDLGVTVVHAAAGDPGKLALAYYEAEHLPGVKEPVWYTHIGQTLDAGSANPTFKDYKVSEIPAYRWTASEMMGICGTPGPTQGVENGTNCSRSTDVWGITLDAQCRISIAWPTKADEFENGNGGTAELPNAKAGTFVTTQTGGPDLCGGSGIPGGVSGAPFAGDGPVPGAGGTGGSGSGGADPLTCGDRVPPTSRVRKVRATRRRITLSGVSTDRGCGRRVRAVSVSIGRTLSRTRCRYLRANGRFGPPVSCLRTSYIVVRGTSRWSLSLKARLAKGRYFVWVRGVDAANNVERKNRRVNLRKFRVR